MSFDFHIIGAGRGGTSLLTGLIDAHPDCAVEAETYSTAFLIGRQWTGAESHSSPALRVPGRIRNFIDACEAASAMSPKKFWGHKTTTEHFKALRFLHPDSSFARDIEAKKLAEDFDYLGCFVEATKKIPIIFIQRDGRTCIRSKMQRTGASLEHAIDNWKFSVAALSAYQKTDAKLLTVKMENLVMAPERSLRVICDFLGVAYTPSMLAGTRSEKMRPEYRQDDFDISVTRHDNPPWAEVIHRELVEWGYSL